MVIGQKHVRRDAKSSQLQSIQSVASYAVGAMSSSADKTEPLLETSGSVEDPAQTDWQYERLDAGKGRGKCGPQSCCCVASFWVLVSVAVIFAGLAIFLPIFAWNMFAEQIADNNRFDSPNATGYNGFVDSAYDANRTLSMYVFDVQNKDGFVNNGEKLNVTEEGPFVYDMRVRKLNLTWNLTTDEVSYREWTTFEFNAEKTFNATGGKYNSDNSTKFTVVDPFFWGMEARIGKAAWWGLNELIPDVDKMFTSRTCRELKNGYTEFGAQFPGLQPDLPAHALERSTVRLGLTDKSAIAQYTVWRGQASLNTDCPWGKIVGSDVYCPQGPDNYDNSSSGTCCNVNGDLGPVPVWQWPVPNGPQTADEIPTDVDTHPPNFVAGTDGNQFGFPDPGPNITVFADPLNRHVEMGRQEVGNTSYVEGIALDRYDIPEDSAGVQNSSVTPYNAAYFMFGPHGVQNGSTVQQGAPIYITNPHFWDTGKDAVDRVIGLHPNREKHQTFLGVEPYSGTTYYSHQRIQVNVQVQTQYFEHVKQEWFPSLMPGNTYVPLVWFDEKGEIQPAFAAQFRDGLALVEDIAYYGAGGCGGISLLAVAGAVVIGVRRCRANPSRKYS